MSKSRKSTDSKPQNPQPLQQQTSSEDLSGDAARIDAAAGEVSESQSPVDLALQPTEEAQEAPKRTRGRPPGSGKGKKKKPEADAAKKEEADRFLKDALGAVVTQSVTIAKAKGWSSPETAIASEQQWCMSVATCLDAVINKYLPDALLNYQEEAALLLLVLPWVTSNLMRGVKRGKDSRGTRGNGIGENNEAVRTDTGVSAPDPDRPHV